MPVAKIAVAVIALAATHQKDQRSNIGIGSKKMASTTTPTAQRGVAGPSPCAQYQAVIRIAPAEIPIST